MFSVLLFHNKTVFFVCNDYCSNQHICMNQGSNKRLSSIQLRPDMKFVQNFTPPVFQVKNFTLSILPNFNSFSKKKTQKVSENGEIYTAGKNFTLPPALTAWTNSTSGFTLPHIRNVLEFLPEL